MARPETDQKGNLRIVFGLFWKKLEVFHGKGNDFCNFGEVLLLVPVLWLGLVVARTLRIPCWEAS